MIFEKDPWNKEEIRMALTATQYTNFEKIISNFKQDFMSQNILLENTRHKN
jgi:hypothetical protein